jgi:hypothetical protein
LVLGNNCENAANLIVLISVLTGVPLLICFFSIIIITVIIIMTIIIILISVFSFKQYKKQQNYSLKNKELTEKLIMFNDLNKIPYSTIKVDKKGFFLIYIQMENKLF